MIRDIGKICSSSGDTLLKMWHVYVPEGKRTFYRHNHLQFEITLIKQGKAVYTTGDKEYIISTGDVLVFASNEMHCITDVTDGELKMINLHFEPRYLWSGSSEILSEKHINFCFSHNPNFENCIKKENAGNLAKLLTSIKGEFESKKEEYPLMIKTYLDMILVELIRNFGYTEESLSLSRSHLKSIRKAVTYIDKHISEELTLEQIADVANLSPNYFSSLFKKVSNITLWQYIASKRIDMAINLLLSEGSTDNMLDVAVKCGFNNTANFNKTFKKITGMTPSEYRLSGDFTV